MKVDWTALLQVFGATLLVTVLVVTLFVVGIRALSGDKKVPAYASFAGCVAVVLYGLSLIVF
ncbi:hypothetical protein ACFWN2_21095 [Lentzea sp. NPDC058436]|uniref:Uncharacterized protein n=2 Tax=Lentzea TaxID=165301 RepID=A0A1I6EW59_9PSEU|nr:MULTISPECIES: hypothetical protein [Lentzea]MCX2950785.1 hypothetical protein [Lentzea sp. NEAU-D7]USX49035.1 hypothetical protein ND450_26700 [Lentzea sp. HUAS12]SER96784.1 hypothetical protein SAMN04488000_1149 [Lentzea albida]SFR21940.1 hypothetical protein SAMN04488564_1069 [Lentzea waywayandensis]